MILTGLEPSGKGKVQVFLDGQPAFILYRSEIARLGLTEGVELSEDLYKEIVQGTLLKRAKLRCMNILKSSDKTEWQLRTKLSQGGYPQTVIDGAVAYVKSFHYVDDVHYARIYIESRSQSRSVRQITQDLMRKGVSREDIAAGFREAETESEEQTIRKLAEKKRMNLQNPTREEAQKYYAFFLRKGFSYSAVRNILHCAVNCEETDTFA